MFSEITVQIMFGKEQAFAAIQMEGFRHVKTCTMHDVYFTHLSRSKVHDYKELIANSVLLRRVNDDYNKIIYKHKFFDENGNVFSEDKQVCKIECWHDMTKIMGLANFNMWCEKKAQLHIFERAGREICIQDIKGLGLFLEIEGDKYTKSITELVNFAQRLRMPLGEDFHLKLPYMLYLKNNS